MKMYTVQETATMFGVSSVAVRNWLKGGLPFKKEKVIGVKTRIIINPADVYAYQNSKVTNNEVSEE